MTDSPEEGRALAFAIARHTVHNIQPDLDVLVAGRTQYSVTPDSLIAASQVVAVEFQTIAAANHYWRPQSRVRHLSRRRREPLMLSLTSASVITGVSLFVPIVVRAARLPVPETSTASQSCRAG